MAKRVITQIVDDLDGGDADETVTFALDGIGFEIDLSSPNAKKLRDFLEPYMDAGSRTGRIGSGAQLRSYKGHGTQRNTSGAGHPSFTQNKALNQAIRRWAEDNGYPLNDRGRIPQHIVDAYHEGKPNPAAAEALAAEQEAAKPKKTTRPRKAASVSFKPEKVSA